MTWRFFKYKFYKRVQTDQNIPKYATREHSSAIWYRARLDYLARTETPLNKNLYFSYELGGTEVKEALTSVLIMEVKFEQASLMRRTLKDGRILLLCLIKSTNLLLFRVVNELTTSVLRT